MAHELFVNGERVEKLEDAGIEGIDQQWWDDLVADLEGMEGGDKMEGWGEMVEGLKEMGDGDREAFVEGFEEAGGM